MIFECDSVIDFLIVELYLKLHYTISIRKNNNSKFYDNNEFMEKFALKLQIKLIINNGVSE